MALGLLSRFQLLSARQVSYWSATGSPSLVNLVTCGSSTSSAELSRTISSTAFAGLSGIDTTLDGTSYASNQAADEVLELDLGGGAPSVLSSDGVFQSLFGLAVVKGVETQTVIDSTSPDPSYVGQTVVVTFEVDGDGPTGAVTVSSDRGESSTCNAAIDPGTGLGSCSIQLNALGNHQLTVEYLGDARHLASVSGTRMHRVVNPVQLYRDNGLGKVGEQGRNKALILVGSYPSVAAALAAAQPDAVQLGASTYVESNLHIAVNNLTLRGAADAYVGAQWLVARAGVVHRWRWPRHPRHHHRLWRDRRCVERFRGTQRRQQLHPRRSGQSWPARGAHALGRLPRRSDLAQPSQWRGCLSQRPGPNHVRFVDNEVTSSSQRGLVILERLQDQHCLPPTLRA